MHGTRNTKFILQPFEKIFHPPKRMDKPNVNHRGVQPENRTRFGQQSQSKPDHFVSDTSISFVRTAKLFLLNPKDRPSWTAN